MEWIGVGQQQQLKGKKWIFHAQQFAKELSNILDIVVVLHTVVFEIFWHMIEVVAKLIMISNWDSTGRLSLAAGWLKIRQSTIYYAGLLGRWDKRIVDQESDVPSVIFSYFL